MKSSGVITMFNPKGFGFILTDKTQIFFHMGDWASLEWPTRGMVVSYEIGPSVNPKFKNQALNVEPVGNPATPVTAPAVKGAV